MNGWQSAYLRALGVQPTPVGAERLSQWQRFEGGHTNNTAKFNYLNTKYAMPGSYDAIGNGVQGYPTLGAGALAFAKTLKGRGDYTPLVQWLAGHPNVDPSQALQVWVSGHPNGDPGYAQRVLGAGSSNGRTPDSGSGGGGSTPSPAASLDSVRQQAAQGFAEIAQGRAKPQDTFSSLIATIHAAEPQPGAPSIPRVAITPGLKGVEAQAAKLVQKYLGVNYQWGGTSPAGFDCSGLVQYVYRSLGVNVPRTTYDQWDAGTPVNPSQLQPGDAVFFTGSDPQNGKPGHEGMYLGNGLFIEAPHSGAQVRVSKLADRTDFVGARRF